MTTSAVGILKSWVTSNARLKPVLKKINNARCAAWDLIHDVDTCDETAIHDMDFQNKNKTAGLEYHSHHPAIIRAGLRALPIRHEDYTFIDFGCGKGRVLLLASELPFRKIIGLEFAPQFVEIARRNLQSYRSSRQRRSNIEVIAGDATEYELEPERQVLYFYSPFSPSVLDQIVQRIEDSFQRSPRDLLVFFSGVVWMRERGFGSRPQYERLSRQSHMDIYQHRGS
jgi:SAM-dependent methyltransferase